MARTPNGQPRSVLDGLEDIYDAAMAKNRAIQDRIDAGLSSVTHEISRRTGVGVVHPRPSTPADAARWPERSVGQGSFGRFGGSPGSRGSPSTYAVAPNGRTTGSSTNLSITDRAGRALGAAEGLTEAIEKTWRVGKPVRDALRIDKAALGAAGGAITIGDAIAKTGERARSGESGVKAGLQEAAVAGANISGSARGALTGLQLSVLCGPAEPGCAVAFVPFGAVKGGDFAEKLVRGAIAIPRQAYSGVDAVVRAERDWDNRFKARYRLF